MLAEFRATFQGAGFFGGMEKGILSPLWHRRNASGVGKKGVAFGLLEKKGLKIPSRYWWHALESAARAAQPYRFLESG